MTPDESDYVSELKMTIADLFFWSKVDKTDSCWIWTGTKDKLGYGTVNLKSKRRKVHRVSYTLIKGKIPTGLVIDHLCQNTSCVNPDHLEAVTNEENQLRKTVRRHEILGHEIRWSNMKKSRTCLNCRNIGYRRNLV